MVVKKRATAMALLLLLTGCGGGGGGSSATGSSGQGGGNSQGGDSSQGSGEASLLAQYQGKKVEAVLDESSVSPFLDAVLDSEPLFGSDIASVGTQASGRVSALRGAVVKTSLDCESGTGTVSGELDKTTGQGTLTVVYNKCLQDGETATGTQLIRYDRWDLLENKPLDYLVTFKGLTLVSSQGSQQLVGTVQRTADTPCSETLTYDLLVNASDPTQSAFADHLVVSDVCQKNSTGHLARSIQGQFYAGVNGRASISSQGLEVAALDESIGDSSKQPMAGSVTIKSNNSQVTLASWLESNSEDSSYRPARSRLNFDHNGDGAVENSVALPSRYLLQEKMRDYRDSDQDGMFDGWEREYGSDPLKADAGKDADKDGNSNQIEYWRGSLRFNKDDAFSLPSGSQLVFDEAASSFHLMQDQSFDLPLTLQGKLPATLGNFFSRVDMVLDLSEIATWDLAVNGSTCRLEANNTRLRCPNIDVSQFSGDTLKKVNLGSLRMTAKQVVDLYLPLHWEKGFAFPQGVDAAFPHIAVTASTFAYAVASPSQAYVLDELADDWSYEMRVVGDGEGSPQRITVMGSWSDDNTQLKSVEGSDWQCDVQPASFSCSMPSQSTSIAQTWLPPFKLHFAKPSQLGKSTLQLTVETDHGFAVRRYQQQRTLAYGVSTALLQQQLQAAEAQGTTEWVIPKGLYVGSLYNDEAHPLTLKGAAGSELWLTQIADGKRHALEAAALEGVTLYSNQPLKVSQMVRNSQLTLRPSQVPSDVAQLEGNHIQIEGLGYTLFAGARDMVIRNNLIQTESAAQSWPDPSQQQELFADNVDGSVAQPSIQMINNTLVGIKRLQAMDAFNRQWQLTNNLFVIDGHSEVHSLFDAMDSVSMSRNLLPASYRSMAGANLYSDKSGVLPTKGYRLGSSSPALDAGDSSVESGTTDLYGNPRLVGASIDIGAAERQ